MHITNKIKKFAYVSVVNNKYILSEIFCHLEPNDLLNCCLVNKKWYETLTNNDIWFMVVKKYIINYHLCKEYEIFHYYLVYQISLKEIKKGYVGMINRKYKPLIRSAYQDFVFIPTNEPIIRRLDFISRNIFIGYYYVILVFLIVPLLIIVLILDIFCYTTHKIFKLKRKICICRSCSVKL